MIRFQYNGFLWVWNCSSVLFTHAGEGEFLNVGMTIFFTQLDILIVTLLEIQCTRKICKSTFIL